MVGVIIGLAVITLLYRKDIFRKKSKPIEPPSKPYKYDEWDRKPDIKYNAIARSAIDFPKLTREEFVSNPIYEYKLRERIDQKLRSLEEQLRKNRDEPGFSLHPRDVCRYEAMIEVLKSMTQI